MGLFKNKVGRPTNEIKISRKIFIVSIISIILSIISIIFACVTLKIISNDNSVLKGWSLFSSDIRVIDVYPSNSKGDKAILAYKWDFHADDMDKRIKDKKCSKDNINSKNLDYCEIINFKFKNNTNDNVYYRWFTDTDYNAESNCDNAVAKDEVKKVEFNLTFLKNDKQRVGWLRIYDTKKQCKDDDNHNKTNLEEIKVYLNLNDGESKKDNNKEGIGFLKVIAQWIADIFNAIFKDDSGNTGTDESTTRLTLDCPSSAVVNEEFTCKTNIVGTIISVTEANLDKDSDYTVSFQTKKGDLTKQSKYTKAGEVTVTAKYGNQKVEKKVKIESEIIDPVNTNLQMYGGGSGKFNHDLGIGCGTKIYAPFTGTATYETRYYNGKAAGYGNVVTVTSTNGKYKVIFAHLSEFDKYSISYGNDQTGISCEGINCGNKNYGSVKVSQGDLLGLSGTSGNSTGCHLHIELYVNGNRVEPTDYFSY